MKKSCFMGMLAVAVLLLFVGVAGAQERDDNLPAEAGEIDEETLDSCFLTRPVPYRVRFCTNDACTAYTDVTNIEWSASLSKYLICLEDIPVYVDGVKTYWYTGAGVCDYCDVDDWDAEYYDTSSSLWADDDTQSCSYSGSNIYYSGYEYSDYNDYEFYPDPQDISRFNRDGTGTDSIVRGVLCPEK